MLDWEKVRADLADLGRLALEVATLIVAALILSGRWPL